MLSVAEAVLDSPGALQTEDMYEATRELDALPSYCLLKLLHQSPIKGADATS